MEEEGVRVIVGLGLWEGLAEPDLVTEGVPVPHALTEPEREEEGLLDWVGPLVRDTTEGV